ncbi:hypothetical protein DPSP01_001948 [Paraphaeosphaeria sporulosa]
MEGSRQFPKRPQSEIKHASHRAPTCEHRRTRSTRSTPAVNSAGQPSRKNYTRDSPPPPSFPAYVDTSKLSLEELTHPSGSPVLTRDFLLNDEEPKSLALTHKLEDEDAITAKEPQKIWKPAETRERDQYKPTKDMLRGVRDRGEEPTFSVAKHVARPGHMEEHHLRPKIAAIGKDRDVPDLRPRKHSANDHTNRQQEAHNTSQSIQIRRKSLPVNARPLGSTATTLEATREWLNNLAAEGTKKWSNKSVVDTSERSEDRLSAITDSVPHSQSGSVKTAVSSPGRPRPLPSKSKPSQSNKTLAKKPASTKQSRNVRPGTPGPNARPTSSPLHRNVAENRKPLERQDQDSWTLYNTSCWTEKSCLKALLKGPVLEFRIEPHGEPFLVDVSQEMLNYFCGEKQVDRLIHDYSLQPEQRREEDGEATILVFPEGLFDATAVMRIIRYMRRCCMRTTTLTKPHFQLHAPPSLEANIDTIRACNIFGLYADARRLQYFLTDKRIPGGKLTMADVETIWEGYNGGLRDSAYTDALLTHLVYNVLGSDSVDREEVMVLLEQEEFAGLRELLSMELGIKKRAAESRDMFQMRKEQERQDKANQKNGKGKRLSKLAELRASRGPMVQGRLLKVLSYDALLVPDLTAELRYKPRPELERRSVSTQDLIDRSGEKELESTGSLYQKALKEIKGTVTETKEMDVMLEGLSEVEEEIVVLSKNTPERPATPTPRGRKREMGILEDRRVIDLEGIRPMGLRTESEPSGAETRATRYPIADNGSGARPFGSQVKAMSPHVVAYIPGTRPNATVQPLYSQRTRVYATSSSSTGFESHIGRTRPGSSVTGVSHAHSTAGNPSVLRSRTDPWWGTLGNYLPITKRKSRTKLKQVWDELRHFI